MVVDLRLERQWSQTLEEGRPDCRLHIREHDRVWRANMWWDKVYCANCGKLEGLVTSDWSPHVFAVCNKCAAKLGEPPAVRVAE